MNSEWKQITIESSKIELIDGDRGKNYPKKNEMFEKGHTLFLNNKNIINDYLDVSTGEYISVEKDKVLRKGKLQRNDIVLSTRGSVGNVGYFHKYIPFDNIRINSGMVIIRNLDEDINTNFLYHLLKSPSSKKQYQELMSGSVQNQLPIRDLKKLKLNIPPLHIQEKIAEVIDSIESKINLNKHILANIEQLTQTLFNRWFFEFEFPNENGEPYKSSGGELVESEFGLIPKGWMIKELGQILDLDYGKPLKKENRENGKYPVYGSNGMVDYHKEFLVKGPGIIVGRKGNPGTVNFEISDFYPIDTTFYVTKKDQRCSWVFLYLLLLNQNLPSLSADSAVPGLNRNVAYKNKVIIPDMDIIDQFDKITSPIFERKYNLKEETLVLESIRNSLLPKLLSGEIDIPIESEEEVHVQV
ncbi:restriction endonuclease subunit S [Bacillus sp. T33-2]|uniref:restriction endonuclease subunit S n=1 Tax=Bacillus sp. T33-2 TaxID=2054168 RepID=UPI000C77D59F|nr:restriction endonuclease subunit S [Bacillus sp. T33-2]PLR94846.1 restriction endonuclease subunit S [Bacillus sp. T33-2]